MDVSCSVHQELFEKTKTANPSGRRFQSSGGDLFGEFPHHTSSGTFVPDQGHLSSPLPGCQTRLRVVPDVGSDRTQPVSRCNKNLCHNRKSALKQFATTELACCGCSARSFKKAQTILRLSVVGFNSWLPAVVERCHARLFQLPDAAAVRVAPSNSLN